MAGSAPYSILIDAELNADKIQKQLDALAKDRKIKVGVEAPGLDKLASGARGASDAMSNLGLTFQESNLIFSRSVEVISSMVDRVFALDSALVEFSKVSSLSGEAMDNYLSKLRQMGSEVARTGKPKCLTPNVGMANQH